MLFHRMKEVLAMEAAAPASSHCGSRRKSPRKKRSTFTSTTQWLSAKLTFPRWIEYAKIPNNKIQNICENGLWFLHPLPAAGHLKELQEAKIRQGRRWRCQVRDKKTFKCVKIIINFYPQLDLLYFIQHQLFQRRRRHDVRRLWRTQSAGGELRIKVWNQKNTEKSIFQ